MKVPDAESMSRAQVEQAFNTLKPRCASLGGPFRSPMNNYWMTNKAMQMAATGFVLELPDDFSILFRYDTPSR